MTAFGDQAVPHDLTWFEVSRTPARRPRRVRLCIIRGRIDVEGTCTIDARPKLARVVPRLRDAPIHRSGASVSRAPRDANDGMLLAGQQARRSWPFVVAAALDIGIAARERLARGRVFAVRAGEGHQIDVPWLACSSGRRDHHSKHDDNGDAAERGKTNNAGLRSPIRSEMLRRHRSL